MVVGTGLATASGGSDARPITWDYLIEDNYLSCRYDGDCSSRWSERDIIGDPAHFDIEHVKVDRTGAGLLTVSIKNTLVGKSGDLFRGPTIDPSGSVTGNTGIGYGDLFLSNFSDAKPYTGTLGPGSSEDRYDNGHQWTHALVFENFEDRYTDDGGQLLLYELNGSNEQNAFLTEDFFDGNFIYRNGQEIAVDRDSTTVDPVEVNINSLTVGSWSVDAANDLLTFAMNDVNGTALADWTGLSLKWSFTCANRLD